LFGLRRLELSIWNYLNIYQDLIEKKRIKTLPGRIEKLLSNVASKPKMYPLFSERLPNVHKAVITKRTTIFYRVRETVREIEVIAVFDTRQDPDKLKIKSVFLGNLLGIKTLEPALVASVDRSNPLRVTWERYHTLG